MELTNQQRGWLREAHIPGCVPVGTEANNIDATTLITKEENAGAIVRCDKDVVRHTVRKGDLAGVRANTNATEARENIVKNGCVKLRCSPVGNLVLKLLERREPATLTLTDLRMREVRESIKIILEPVISGLGWADGW